MSAARRICALVALLGALTGCQQGGDEGYGVTSGNGEISPVAGALGGAGLGALAGRLIAGKHDNSEAMLGGALIGGLGGLIGSQAYDAHKKQEAQQQSEQQAWAQNQAAQQAAAAQQAESQKPLRAVGPGAGLCRAGQQPCRRDHGAAHADGARALHRPGRRR